MNRNRLHYTKLIDQIKQKKQLEPITKNHQTYLDSSKAK